MRKMRITIAFGLALFLLLFSSMNASAYSGHFYVYQYQKGYWYGVMGYNHVRNNSIYDSSGVASFFAVLQPNGDWLAVGFFQGHTPYGEFYSTPQFYVDWQIQGNYGFERLKAAPLDTDHNYKVYSTMQFYPPDGGGWYAHIDLDVVAYKTGYSYANGIALGESESHDTRNSLEFHYWNLNYAGSGLYWYPFDNTDGYQDYPPYWREKVSDTEFYSHGQGSY